MNRRRRLSFKAPSATIRQPSPLRPSPDSLLFTLGSAAPSRGITAPLPVLIPYHNQKYCGPAKRKCDGAVHQRTQITPSFLTRGSQMTIMDRFRLAPESIQGTSILPALNGRFNLIQALPPQPPRQVSSGIPMGFDRLLNHSPEPSPVPRRVSTSPRYHLHIRQQPIAARACGAGDRDRRPVDPPPIIQMLLTDFDPKSQADLDTLQDPRLTVGCLLLPVSAANSWPGSPEADGLWANREDRTTSQRAEENGPGRGTPLLSGKAFVSPFHVELDPDPHTAPPRPTSANYKVETKPGAANPSNGLDLAKVQVPATFFVFPDLSIRSAGVYRLQFRLMNWGLVEDTGQSMPVLAEVWSDPFRVYPAKDFPGMRDSSPLTEALKELGFVELKTRGKGKGKGRRR
ncbi:hypothetical protein KXW96_005338 [Aspergillus fumigatus]|nr:hypothetical protein KXW96_005338 [Aspergillus fumigatus]